MVIKMKNQIQKNKNFFIDNFFPKNHKAQMDNLMKTILWIVVFVILSIGVYSLVKYLTGP